jgi:hypothetical protein
MDNIFEVVCALPHPRSLLPALESKSSSIESRDSFFFEHVGPLSLAAVSRLSIDNIRGGFCLVRTTFVPSAAKGTRVEGHQRSPLDLLILSVWI